MLITFTVRNQNINDITQIIEIYQQAFAEPPWNEVWTKEQVVEDLTYAKAQKNSIILVAELHQKIVGFTWGYELPIDKFPFLKKIVQATANYMDEIAIDPTIRMNGVGKYLGTEYLKRAQNQVILRTDINNQASMNLFQSLGFTPLQKDGTTIFDPVYPTRIYLRQVR